MKKKVRISENAINKAVKHSLSELFNRNNNQQSDNVNSTYTQFTTRLSDMLYQYEMLNSIMGEQGFLNSLGQQGNEVKKYIEMSRQFIEYACYGAGFGSGNNNLGVTPQHKSYFKTTNNAQFDFQNILGDIYYQYSILDSLMSTNGFINSLPNGKNIYKYISSAKDYIERACSILGVSGQHKSYMSESRKRIRLSESDLKNMVKESVKRIVKQRKKLNEAEDYGWVVESSEAREAYDFACEYFGQENLNQDIVDALSTDELAACLAFIFRMNDFREWDERNDGDFEEDDEINESAKRVLKENSDNNETWYVQETIGGWRQNPVFSGTYDECVDYLNSTSINGAVSIVPESEMEVDYLENDDKEYVPYDDSEPRKRRERWITSKDGSKRYRHS